MPKIRTDPPQSFLPDREQQICARIRMVRQHFRFKQVEFADMLSISVERLKSHEYARAPIRYDMAVRLCEELDVSQSWLATGDLPMVGAAQIPAEYSLWIPSRLLFSAVFDRLLQGLIRDGPRAPTNQDLANLIGWAFVNFFEKIPPGSIQNTIEGINGLIGPLPKETSEAISHWISSGAGRAAPEAIMRTRDEVLSRLGLDRGQYREANEISAIVSALEHVETIESRLNREGKSLLTYRRNVDTHSGRYEQTTPVNMQKNHIATRIKRARKQLGISQREAAEKWGFPVQTIQQWEHGRREPRALYAEKIESILAEIERDGKRPAGEAR